MTTRIPNLLHHILAATMASGAAACGGIDLSGYDPIACSDNGYDPQTLADLASPESPDYLALYVAENFGGTEPPTMTETRGEACASASDASACQAAIDAATAEMLPDQGFELGQCVQVCSRYHLLVNSGDDVRVVTDQQGVQELLGAIDTPLEAVTAARLARYNVSCGDVEQGGVKQVANDYEVIATKLTAACDPVESTRFQLSVEASGTVTELDSQVVSSESGACVGRRPACHVVRAGKGSSELGAYFASVAHLEEAAVYAFAELARELEHHGAPRDLVARARRSCRDEVRHARLMREVASEFGGQTPRARPSSQPVRCLEAIAVDNAVEGCVRETFGALIGLWQGAHARDARVRDAMTAVALDEVRHAQLSWDVHAWLMLRLDLSAQARVEAAREQAMRQLVSDASEPHASELVAQAGMPTVAKQRELAERFARQVA
jgi:hypothetical protein